MSRKIGDVLARTFREICEESNAKVKTDFSRISAEEIDLIEKILTKADSERFDLQQELKKYLKLEGEQ